MYLRHKAINEIDKLKTLLRKKEKERRGRMRGD
jgi:hypothetical protein